MNSELSKEQRASHQLKARGSRSVFFLFWGVWRQTVNRFRYSSREEWGKWLYMLFFGGILWSLITGGAWRILHMFGRYPEISEALMTKMLALAFAAAFVLATIAITIASLGVFYMDSDQHLFLAAPVDWLQHYLSKFFRSLFHGSWAVVLAFTPILVAVGLVRGFTPEFLVTTTLGGGFMLMAAASLGNGLALGLSWLGGAHKAKGWMMALGALTVGGVLLYFRSVAPERLFSPASYQSSLAMVEMLNAPTFPWLPSEWWAQAVIQARDSINWWAMAALLGAALGGPTISAAIFWRFYRDTLTRGEQQQIRNAENPLQPDSIGERLSDGSRRLLERHLGAAATQMAFKDVRRLWRDTSGWSHGILIVFSLVVYFYNLHLLPTGGGDEISQLMGQALFLISMGVGALILAAIAAHFLLPSISLESPGLWLYQSSPSQLDTLIEVKFRVGLALLLPFGVGVSLISVWLLQGGWELAVMAGLTSFTISLAIIAMAVWFGAARPVFKAKSPAEIASSSGATLYTFTSIGLAMLVIALQAPFVLDLIQQTGSNMGLWQPIQTSPWRVQLGVLGSLVIPLLVTRIAIQRARRVMRKKVLEKFRGKG